MEEKRRERLLEELNLQLPTLYKISEYIYENPELAFQEEKAAQILCEYLSENGFSVEKGLGGLSTAFRATWDSPGKQNKYKNIAYTAEYDALPGLGHGCGHNLIAASAAGSAAVLKAVLEKEDCCGRVTVIGTPAEESGGGKILLIEKGVFNDISACMMMHPTSGVSRIAGSCLSSHGLTLRWKGKTAHAESHPEDGINALDALHVYYTAVSCLRQQLPPDVRIAQIVKNGGVDEGLIPDETVMVVDIVSLDSNLLPTVKKVKRCAEGAAIATGCTLEITEHTGYLGRIPNKRLAQAAREQFAMETEPLQEGLPEDFGTTDFGNVTRLMPCVNPYVSLLPERKISNHSELFRELANSERSREVIAISVRVMAGLGLSLFLDDSILEEAWAEFRQTMEERKKINGQ